MCVGLALFRPLVDRAVGAGLVQPTLPGRSPYRLYALSNFGSLVALFGYPFYVERRFDVGRQAWLWGLGFIGFALVCGAGGHRGGRGVRGRGSAQRLRLDGSDDGRGSPALLA